MAFWGIEVKPGKPVTHSFEKVKRRLRISQATLGIGTAVQTSLVQCNVGNKSPVFLCALLPKRTESCHLDLEFEEAEDVIFSVIGPRSVYLTGYYVGNGRHSALHSDTESFGEDIANSETEQSVHDSDDDQYDDSFIDDGYPEVFPPSPVPSDGVHSDAEDLVNIDKADRKGCGQRRQRIILSDSEEQTSSPENEDEDRIPLSALIRKRAVKNGYEIEEKTEDQIVEINEHINTTCSPTSAPLSEEKVDAATLLQKPNSDLGSTKKTKSKRKRKQEFDKHEECIDKQSKVLQTMAEDHSQRQDSLQPNDANERIIKLDIDGEAPQPKIDDPSSKKRKKDEKDKSNGSSKTTSADLLKGITAAVGKDVKNLPASILKYKKPNADVETNSDPLPEEPKKKKKKDKTKKNKDIVHVPLSSDNESEKLSKSGQRRSLTNGLVIEELTSGDHDAKKATLGKKVKIYYTGRLKESGCVVDSNIGKAPYKFRLGDKEIIEGWNVGIEGMRVGDKRRLTIPPSLGYGEQGNGENVPPNSWLEFDIELVRAH